MDLICVESRPVTPALGTLSKQLGIFGRLVDTYNLITQRSAPSLEYEALPQVSNAPRSSRFRSDSDSVQEPESPSLLFLED